LGQRTEGSGNTRKGDTGSRRKGETTEDGGRKTEENGETEMRGRDEFCDGF
jgi:hypothetical protein